MYSTAFYLLGLMVLLSTTPKTSGLRGDGRGPGVVNCWSNISSTMVHHNRRPCETERISRSSGRSLQAAGAQPSNVQITSDGMWFWFGDPRAVYHAGSKSTYMGWVTKSGNLQVGGLNHQSGKPLTPFTLGKATTTAEFLSPPLLVLGDGRIAAFYTLLHNGNKLYFRTTQKPGDITQWTAAKEIPSACPDCPWSYPQPFRNPSKPNSLSVVTRHKDRTFHLTTSENSGATWSAPMMIITPPGADGFAKVFQDNSGGLLVTFNGDKPQDVKVNKVYYGYLKNDCWFKASGVKIKCLVDGPMKPSEADVVYSQGNTWVWDIASTPGGAPVIVFASFVTPSNHVYRYARWNGKSWTTSPVASGGGWTWTPVVSNPVKQYYSGGIVLDKKNPNVLYLSRPGSTSRFQIEQWNTADNGASWKSVSVLSSSSAPSFRPVYVSNPSGLMLAWLQIKTYVSNAQFDTSVRFYIK